MQERYDAATADLAPVVRKPFDFEDFVSAVRAQLDRADADDSAPFA